MTLTCNDGQPNIYKYSLKNGLAFQTISSLLSYEDLTATHSGSCADDLYR